MQTPFQEDMWNVSLLRISKREIEIEIDTTTSPGQRGTEKISLLHHRESNRAASQPPY